MYQDALITHLRPGFKTTGTTKQVRELLLATDGWTFYNGIMYDIKNKPMGAGVHQIWLVERGA